MSIGTSHLQLLLDYDHLPHLEPPEALLTAVGVFSLHQVMLTRAPFQLLATCRYLTIRAFGKNG